MSSLIIIIIVETHVLLNRLVWTSLWEPWVPPLGPRSFLLFSLSASKPGFHVQSAYCMLAAILRVFYVLILLLLLTAQ